MSRRPKKDHGPYKSGLEVRIAALIEGMGRRVVYESDKIKYTIPSSEHSYRPDFKLKKKVFIEGKGRLLPSERKKHLLIKEQHPDIDIRFFFENADKPIYKGSKTSYGDWCTKHGFEYTDVRKGLPEDWLK